VQGRKERLEFIASFETVYHFRLLYNKPYWFPIYGALRKVRASARRADWLRWCLRACFPSRTPSGGAVVLEHKANRVDSSMGASRATHERASCWRHCCLIDRVCRLRPTHTADATRVVCGRQTYAGPWDIFKRVFKSGEESYNLVDSFDDREPNAEQITKSIRKK